jgi:hypothetical protein
LGADDHTADQHGPEGHEHWAVDPHSKHAVIQRR